LGLAGQVEGGLGVANDAVRVAAAEAYCCSYGAMMAWRLNAQANRSVFRASGVGRAPRAAG
jgi:hypothetical protein